MSSRPHSKQPSNNSHPPHQLTVAVVGLGYVGLPTAVALRANGAAVIGIDTSSARLDAIRAQSVELIPEDRERLDRALVGDPELFQLTNDPAAVSDADAIIIAVPTPITATFNPDLTMVSAATASVVQYARAGQVILLTSTTYVGCTRDLLVDPLAARGFHPGRDIHVAFAPERIDPGNTRFPLSAVPRVLGAVSEESHQHAWTVLKMCAPEIHSVSSLEAAEMTKLVENTFRAVNIAWINEMADVAAKLGLDIAEVIDAASTKPYGYTRFTPGAGVGGHCIPCDPHYLLDTVPTDTAPITTLAMASIHDRPKQIASLAIDLLTQGGVNPAGATVLIAGVAYKPNIQDYRESPAITIIEELMEHGVDVQYYDPLVDQLPTESRTLSSVEASSIASADLVIWHTPHDVMNAERLLEGVSRVLDTTYRLHLDDAEVTRP